MLRQSPAPRVWFRSNTLDFHLRLSKNDFDLAEERKGNETRRSSSLVCCRHPQGVRAPRFPLIIAKIIGFVSGDRNTRLFQKIFKAMTEKLCRLANTSGVSGVCGSWGRSTYCKASSGDHEFGCPASLMSEASVPVDYSRAGPSYSQPV